MNMVESIKQDKENDEMVEKHINIEMFGVENADIEYYKQWVEKLKEKIKVLNEENMELREILYDIHEKVNPFG